MAFTSSVVYTAAIRIRAYGLFAPEGLAMLKLHFRQLIAILLLSTFSVLLHGADLKPEDIVAHHLNALGTTEARAGAKTRVVQGVLKFHVLVGGAGELTGTWGRVSSGKMSNFVMRFGGGDWRGEQFTYDGSKTGFAASTSEHRRSAFAQFISSHDFVIKEGLLGGELSTGWALLDLEANHAKLEFLSLRKVDGKELLAVQYQSKHSNDLEVKIYFDPDSYRHVLTTYSLVLAPNLGGNVVASASQREIRYTLEERFGDFQEVDGLTLPRHYDLQWTEELQDGTTREYDWDMRADQIRHNLSLDPANFRPK